MTLKDQIAADISTVFLNTDEMAETVSYTPKDGAERDITVVVQRETIRYEERDHHKLRVRTIEVLAKKSASAGVVEPKLGDRITRDVESHAHNWSFIGTVDEDAAAAVLEYRTQEIVHAGRVRPGNL